MKPVGGCGKQLISGTFLVDPYFMGWVGLCKADRKGNHTKDIDIFLIVLEELGTFLYTIHK